MARLIATDLDGTLLDSSGALSGRSARALRGAAEAGLLLVCATARPLWSAVALLRDAAPVRYLVASNGAVVAELPSERVLRTVAMPAALTAAAVTALAERCPGAVWALDRAHDRVLSPDWPDVLVSGAARVRRSTTVPPGQDVLCLMVIGCPPEVGDDLARRLGLGCTSSSAGLLELSAPGADKRTALEWVLSRSGAGPLAEAVYGDAPNDLGMFALARTAVAVGNAAEEVLLAADEVIGTNDEDGVAAHLEELALHTGTAAAAAQEKDFR